MNEKIIQISEKIRKKAIKYPKRTIYNKIIKLLNDKTFIGIAGLRGVGKTVLLGQLSDELDNSIYISCDLVEEDIYKIAEEAEQMNMKYLLLDEISYVQKWRKKLKKIYDLTEIKVIFTSSSAIDIINSKIDLSRRVQIINMYPFSFNEFLQINKGINVKCIKKMDDKIKNLIRYEVYFEEYCLKYALPASRDNANISGIVERIIENDLIRYSKLTWQEIIEIKKMFMFIANSIPEKLSYSQISKNIGITKYKAERYVKLLSDSFLLNVVNPIGRNIMKEPQIYITLPFRAYISKLPKNLLTGTMREEFAVMNLISAGKKINYVKGSKGEKIPDFYINGTIIEVGGKSKSRTQFKGIKYKKKIIAIIPGKYSKDYIPLISLGMLCR